MRFDRIELRGVGPFESLDLAFPPGDDPARADVHLLVGPNGTGKTTLLRALGQHVTATDLGLVPRLWGPDSWVTSTFRGLDHYPPGPLRMVPRARALAEGRAPGPPWAEKELVPGLVHDATGGQDVLERQRDLAPALTGMEPGGPCLVFAYGNERTTPTTHGALGLPDARANPVAGAVSLSRPDGLQDFVNWVFLVRTTQALLASQGDPQGAERHAAGLTRLEVALADILGAPVSFQLRPSPLAVQLRLGGGPPCALDLLPDGVRSLLGWLGDLLQRLERIPWVDGRPGVEQSFVLLLDEVEAHLHPTWQRHVLPVVERLLPSAQIIASTHSPFVISSGADCWVHRLAVSGGRAHLVASTRAPRGTSYQEILRDLMGLPSEFDPESERHLRALQAARDGILTGDPLARGAFDGEADWLRKQSDELATIVALEVSALRRRGLA